MFRYVIALFTVALVAYVASGAPEHEVDQNCVIKGNISVHGKIYHVPGGEYYEATQIDTLQGERWFCSEAEALKAGWRRSRR